MCLIFNKPCCQTHFGFYFPLSKNGIGHIVEVELISKCMCKVQWNIFRPFFASITRGIIFNQREAIYRKAFWHLSCLDSMLLLYLNAFKLEIVSKQLRGDQWMLSKIESKYEGTILYFVSFISWFMETHFGFRQRVIKNAQFTRVKITILSKTYLLEGILTSVTPP